MNESLVWAAALVVVTALLCATALAAWRGWLAHKEIELAARRPGEEPASARIELASVRERLRRLEAIATGIDL